jgi:RNA polymerase-binding transcription factor DksA
MSADLAIGSPPTPAVIGSPHALPASDSPSATPVTGSPQARPESGPEAGAAHLAAEALPRWRALLEYHWRARLERVTELSLAYHDAEEARTHPGDDQASAARPTRPLLRLAVAERRALAEIEAALARLSNGCYGTCERCGGSVSAPRLTRLPQTRYCAACEPHAA